MKKRTYTVVFIKTIGNTNYPVPDYYRQYKDKRSAYRAMSKYYAETGCEAFIVRGDKRDSHKRKSPSINSVDLVVDNILTSQSLL